MPNPTLIIGLGGTGKWMATRVLHDLMKLYRVNNPNVLPPEVRILSVDTDNVNPAAAGQNLGAFGDGGQVTLAQPQVVHLDAQMLPFIQEIADGRHPHLAAWFDARHYLTQPNAASLLNLAHGARRQRPLGRIAVAYSLTQAPISYLRRSLDANIQTILHSANADHLRVFVAGSLGGGTSSGMFVDVAHLVRTLAAPASVDIVGYLALPQDAASANSGDIPVRASAFAALRELHRLSRPVEWGLGIPMFYRQPEGDDVLHGRLNRPPFDLLYFVGNQPARPEHGVAPLIAENILLWVDERAGARLENHLSAVSSAKTQSISAGHLKTDAVVAGGVSAFALLLPLTAIVEGWTHRLAREALRQFLGAPQPEQEDLATHTVAFPRSDWPGGRPGEDGVDFARQADAKGHWPGNQGVGRLAPDFLETGYAMIAGGVAATEHVRALECRTTERWEWFLGPAGGKTPDEEHVCAKVLYPVRTGTWPFKKHNPDAQVKMSTQLGGVEARHPEDGAERIRYAVERFFDHYLGEVGTDGARGAVGGVEGEYRALLRIWCREHLDQFRAALAAQTRTILNGVSDLDPSETERADNGVQNRAGKLGFLLAYLNEMSATIQEAEKALADLRDKRLVEATTQRANPELSLVGDLMTRQIDAQQRFLAQQQAVLDAEKQYAVARAAHDAAAEMLAYVSSALASAQQWQRALCCQLYQMVWDGQELVQVARQRMENLAAVRRVINVPEYEAARYDSYVGKNGLAALLNDLRWHVSIDGDGGPTPHAPTVTLGLRLAGRPLRADGHPDNTDILLNRCRHVFRDAWGYYGKERLLGWLAGLEATGDPDWSMEQVVGRVAEGFRSPVHHTARPYRLGYVQADQRRIPEEAAFLTSMVHRLEAELGVGAGDLSMVDCHDPLRLTFHTFDELVEMEKLEIWEEGRREYDLLPERTDPAGGPSRRSLHVLPAEVSAVSYEERLGRPLPDRVVALLDDRTNLRLFALAWAFGQAAGRETLLHTHHIPQGHTGADQWTLCISSAPSDTGLDIAGSRHNAPQHRWLTASHLHPDEISLLEAAENFVLGGFDRWQDKDGMPLPIDYDQIEQSIRTQVALGTLDDANSELSAGIQAIRNIDGRRIAELELAEHTHLTRMRHELLAGLTRHQAMAGGRQEDVDLVDVMAFLLAEEQGVLDARIRRWMDAVA